MPSGPLTPIENRPVTDGWASASALKWTGKFPDNEFLDRLEGYVWTRLAQVSSSGGASIAGTG